MPDMQQRHRISLSGKPQADPHTPSSIPPWVHINDGIIAEEDVRLLSSPPPNIVPNTRHYKPPPTAHKLGRKWDHLRSAEPPFLSMNIADHQARWGPFMDSGPLSSSRHGRDWENAGARVVDQAWLDENMPVVSQKWDPEDELPVDGHGPIATGFSGWMYRGKWLVSPERQERTVRLFWRLLLKNPFVPLAFRIMVLTFSITGLGIAATIYVAVHHVNTDADQNNQCSSRASTFMAIVVGTVAIPYLGYITWDEYMSKPLGLRSVAAKTLLLLLDLFFIVFSASNLSLAFDALLDHRWACYDEQYEIVSSSNPNRQAPATCPDNPAICYRQKALSGVLFVGLCAWMSTFSISVMRVVEKLRPD